MNSIVQIEQALAEFRESFLSNLSGLSDFELVDFQNEMILLFNESPSDWLSANRMLCYTAGIPQLCLWMEEFIAENKDLKEARKEWEKQMLDNDCLCDGCRFEFEEEDEDDQSTDQIS